jgi:hypothetical protein
LTALDTLDDLIKVAIEELDVAIELFLSERSFVAVVALAAAAESLFANRLKSIGQETALDWEFALIDNQEIVWPFFRIYDVSLGVKKRREHFQEFKLRERHFVNHGPDNHHKERRTQQRAQRPSLKDVAEEAIDRACWNASRLGIPRSDAVRRYEDWFYSEVIGPL